jgi:hypothetical protein
LIIKPSISKAVAFAELLHGKLGYMRGERKWKRTSREEGRQEKA